MQFRIKQKVLIYIACGIIPLLTSCGAKNSSFEGEPEKTRPISLEKTVPQIHEQKPGASVTLVSTNLLSSELNKVSEDVISVSLMKDKEWQVVVSSDAEIEVQSVAQMTIPADDTNSSPVRSTFDIPVRWKAKQSGRYYLHLHFSRQTAESVEARDIGLIIVVKENSSGAKSSLPLQKSVIEKQMSSSPTNSSNVIELPAEEKIKSKK